MYGRWSSTEYSDTCYEMFIIIIAFGKKNYYFLSPNFYISVIESNHWMSAYENIHGCEMT